MAYDVLHRQVPSRADREYLLILHLAALESETGVDRVLQHLIEQEHVITATGVEALLQDDPPATTQGWVASVDLGSYDCLLQEQEATR